MEVTIDKRLEILEAIILAYQVKNRFKNQDLDFVEYPNIEYVKNIVEAIHIEKYSEIYKFIEDEYFDCGYYTELYLYFDDEMNFYDTYRKNVFQVGSNKEFASIVKRIYDEENLDEIFIKYHGFFNEIINYIKSITNYNLDDIYAFYNNDKYKFNSVVSLLINGGFSSKRENEVSYVKGLNYENGNIMVSQEYYIICLYHEFSHAYVNEMIDKYYDLFTNIDSLYDESLENNLSETYRNKKTLLYEYIVRANSLILAKNHVNEEEINEDIKWYKSIGFIRIEELIEIIEDDELERSDYTSEQKVLYITITSKTVEQMMNEYSFSIQQREQVQELLKDDYASLWAAPIYGISLGSPNMVTIALSQVGNVGGEPYWSWYGFNSRVAWCACFVSWVAYQSGYIQNAIIPKFAGVRNGVDWFKAMDEWHDKNYVPHSGDIIFFDWENDGKANHVGIVEKVENNKVYTIEGNSNDECKQKEYSLNSNVIYGYGVPLY